MGLFSSLLLLFLQLIPCVVSQFRDFVSIDCGGSANYTDSSTGLTWISDDRFTRYGNASQVRTSSENRQQYMQYRYFPADSKKYCYTLSTVERRRYLVRATFLYGNSNTDDPYPSFQLYLDSTRWSTIMITDASRIYIEEMIIRAPSTSIHVCLCCASTGSPFISTLELRPLNFSMYATNYEDDFYLKVAARVNFGALSKDAIRYPDDPYDRIWESDLNRRQNFLVGVAPGTIRIATSKKIKTGAREFPPVQVMQTAVVGTKGSLTYRLNLDGFPANARAYAYLAEIEDLGINETRKFSIRQPYVPGYSNAVVNIAENANGSYALYEPSYMNVSLDFVLSFSFVKTPDSTRGPLLNAIEISKYVQITPKTDGRDATVLEALHSLSSQSDWAYDDGDPCIPVPWEWVNCSSSTPPRITKIYDGNPELIKMVKNRHHLKLILSTSMTAFTIFILFLIGSLLVFRYLQRKAPPEKISEKGNSLRARSKPSTSYSLIQGGSLIDDGPDVAYITLSELEEATQQFSKKIGKGSFGPVYYGKMKDGKEVAVKILADASNHGTEQFVNEVALLSRIHHRNLVPFIGYCEEESQRILVYEYMHNGTLHDHLHDSANQKHLDWLSRLTIAEDAAKGLQYLHSGCNPSIIHRDVKTSNILLDISMMAKVSDFGLSRQTDENLTHISSVARGTVGYLDPEYYANQQLTEKSDVYSFGVVLLELISGRRPVSAEDYGAEWNIVHWARSLVRKGNVTSILDPKLAGNIKIESVWRVIEVAILSVEPNGASRPKMQEIVLAIQDAIRIEKGSQSTNKAPSTSSSIHSSHLRFPSHPLDIVSSDFSTKCVLPSAR
ncbi:probable LRR receptor-like serine/threonine-protein kinase At1g67720 isoform X3 [Magnolia sinica]|uniref:probable LRR receptor-like serine/threonine-protein kinase At1g67720 isoform X3 n=1 Tax=Magnolia sinica TaxID=86752 RepID=UPI00265B6635|nr:probable LRR receptor-like serine/threonine-protein kinase At1g67720 isoform X3 [Magnolia sinica]